MKKRMFSAFLALILCLGLLPAASAAEAKLPDWYFLFAIFKNVDANGKDKNGKTGHAKYSMPQGEIDFIMEEVRDFEGYMNQVGVMRAHIDVVEIDATVTKLGDSNYGSWLLPEQAAALLDGKVDLDKYDHVFCIVSLNTLDTSYLGLTGAPFENGTGHSCINLRSLKYCLNTLTSTEKKFPSGFYVHEFLHFMNQLDEKWGLKFGLHDIGNKFYASNDDRHRACYTDIILNRAKGNAGTGVHPAAWQYPPHVLRTMTELKVPSGVASIGTWAFGNRTALTRVSLPASVTSIGYAAFWKTGITDVYYSGSEAQWKSIQFGEFNDALTKANIHYNSGTGSIPTVAVDNIPANGTAYASTQNITINGKAVKFDAYALKDANGNLTNYVKLRDVAVALNGTSAQFEVGYDGTIYLTTKTAYTGGNAMGTPFSGNRAYQGGAQSVRVNGQPVDMTAITLYDSNKNGYNYFKLRDLGTVLGFYVGYSNETGISIDTTR